MFDWDRAGVPAVRSWVCGPRCPTADPRVPDEQGHESALRATVGCRRRLKQGVVLTALVPRRFTEDDISSGVTCITVLMNREIFTRDQSYSLLITARGCIELSGQNHYGR
jgi:hypothetical protein